MTLLDDHGQPVNRQYGKKRRSDRTLDELIGLAKGITADEVVNQLEADFLIKWMQRNYDNLDDWVTDSLFIRLDAMLADGRLDAEEQEELLILLNQFTGQVSPADELENFATTLPLDRPAPTLRFDGRLYCFTGKFVSGTRRQVQDDTVQMGASCTSNPTRKTDYLVIGWLGSDDWAHTSFGRKIEKAIKIKQDGYPLKIVAEEHWSRHAYGGERI